MPDLAPLLGELRGDDMVDVAPDPYAYPPIGMNREAAARYVGLPPGSFDILVKIGRYPRPKMFGDAAVWDRAELEEAFRALPADGQQTGKRSSGLAMSEEYPGYHHVYTPESLAERWRCSGTHVRNMIKRGDLVAFKYGGKLIRITAATVAAYEKTNTVEARR